MKAHPLLPAPGIRPRAFSDEAAVPLQRFRNDAAARRAVSARLFEVDPRGRAHGSEGSPSSLTTTAKRCGAGRPTVGERQSGGKSASIRSVSCRREGSSTPRETWCRKTVRRGSAHAEIALHLFGEPSFAEEEPRPGWKPDRIGGVPVRHQRHASGRCAAPGRKARCRLSAYVAGPTGVSEERNTVGDVLSIQRYDTQGKLVSRERRRGDDVLDREDFVFRPDSRAPPQLPGKAAAEGRVIDRRYDESGRLVSETTTEKGAANEDVSYTRDDKGRVIARNRRGSIGLEHVEIHPR